jgi:hypothetical protein
MILTFDNFRRTPGIYARKHAAWSRREYLTGCASA